MGQDLPDSIDMPQTGGRRVITSEDIERLFPPKVIAHSEDYVVKAPRAGISLEVITGPSAGLVDSLSTDPEALTGCDVWKFAGIKLRENEAGYIGLPPFDVAIDYFGGPDEHMMLFRILKIIGQSKDEKNISPFRLFFDSVAIGVLGSSYGSIRDDGQGGLPSNAQVERFKRALARYGKPVLILVGHGGGAYTKEGREEKTIGQGSPKSCSLQEYLKGVGVEKYSAILDMSCTVTPKFCTQTLQGLLPENCPPFFGALNPIEAGLGMTQSDTYIIEDHRTLVYPKKA